MADVRLTATNPADSSVVPVACNEKGELKLEEIPDQSFDGNLDGDLTVSGSATFANNVEVKNVSGEYSLIENRGRISLLRDDITPALEIYAATDAPISSDTGDIKLYSNGDATFKGQLSVDKSIAAGNFWTDDWVTIRSFSQNTIHPKIRATHTAQQTNGVLYLGDKWYDEDHAYRVTFTVDSDGAATFAGNKAGFTAEGYLWCTTRRGDTVILDATSNGLASWVEYTPPTRRDQIKDLDRPTAEPTPEPEVSQQDESETPQ